ncbi:MAG: hypothetical protein IT427_08675 [Pirellulales bacterium]|nr:hypothetical protein [Pirellulales bacterium]
MKTRMTRGSVLMIGLCAVLAVGAATWTNSTANGAVIAADDFNRAPSDNLGVTPIGGYAWNETENAAGTISIVDVSGNGKAQFNSRGNGTDPVAMLNVGIADVDISVTMQSYIAPGGNYFGGIRYRSPVPSAGFASDVNLATAGYAVEVVPGAWGPAPYSSANMIGLRYANNTYLAQVVLPNPILIDTDYVLRVVANGDSHKVYWDGGLVIDYNETTAGRTYAGGVGLGAYYGSWYFDNFSVEQVPEPLGFITMGLGALAGLMMCARRRN